MDAIARERGLDPLDVRKANFYRRRRATARPTARRVEDNILPRSSTSWRRRATIARRRAAIARLQRHQPDPQAGHRADAGEVRHLVHADPSQPGRRAGPRLYATARSSLNHGGTEMGQGLFIKVAQVVAEEFGVAARQGEDHRDQRPPRCPTPRRPPPRPAPTSTAWRRWPARAQIKDRLSAFIAEKWGVAPRRGRRSATGGCSAATRR